MIKFIMAAESKQLYLIYFQEANIYKYLCQKNRVTSAKKFVMISLEKYKYLIKRLEKCLPLFPHPLLPPKKEDNFKITSKITFRKNGRRYCKTIHTNPLSANPTKWSNTLKKFVGCCRRIVLSVFDHFFGLALKD